MGAYTIIQFVNCGLLSGCPHAILQLGILYRYQLVTRALKISTCSS